MKNRIIKIFAIIVTILLIFFVIYAIQLGILQDRKLLIQYIKSFGLIAPIFFLLLQIIQVVVPIIPGGASCLAGVLAFGPLEGFIYNYVGLIAGSLLAFQLSKKYGLSLIKKIFSEESINKYLNYINTTNFTKIFFLVILIPSLPDDLFCYLAGLTKMKQRTFFIILLLGKPLTLIIYSLFVNLF